LKDVVVLAKTYWKYSKKLLTLPVSLRGQGLMPVFFAKLLDRHENFFYIYSHVKYRRMLWKI